MRPSKLYIKIFVSFLVILIITEIAIFGFFVAFAGRQYRDYSNKFNDSRFTMAKELIEYRLRESMLALDGENSAFNAYIDHLGIAFNTMIWISDDHNDIVFKSFKGDIPDRIIKKNQAELEADKKQTFFPRRNQFRMYRSDRISINAQKTFTFHMLTGGDKPQFKHSMRFALGLASIGLIIALLTFPVSRQITKKVKSLTDSAKRLEQGDLSHRTIVSTRDELGELGTAFNRMAGKLETMVKTGKELTAQVSHELRSPLTRIQVAVEILKDRFSVPKDPELTANLEEIQAEIEELDRLIGRILELSKLDLQPEVSYTDIFSPISLIENALAKYASSIENKNINLKVDLAIATKMIGNKHNFAMAVHNLLDNACRYTPVQGTMQIRGHLQSEQLYLSFSNSCSQLTAEQLERVFEPFYRIDPTEENGGGLGLAIAKKVIEKHKGEIQARNCEIGLEFSLSLPTVKVG